MNSEHDLLQENPFQPPSVETTNNDESNSDASPPRVWPSILLPFAGLALAICLQTLLIIGMIIFQKDTGFDQSSLTEALTNPSGFLLLLISGQLSFLAAVVVAAYASPVPFTKRLAFPPQFASAKIYVLTMLGSIMVLAISIAAAYGVAHFVGTDESIKAFFDKLTVAWAIPFVILIALLPGFIEEIMFRGYIQKRFLKRWSPVTAILFSSFLFALVHVSPPTIALALILGIWFGYVAWRCGSIGPGIACHAFVNGSINLWRMTVKFSGMSDSIQYVCLSVFAVVGIVCFILAIRELQSLTPPISECG